MATGYEDYIIYLYTQPTVALPRLQQHLVVLMEQEASARTGADWVTYDPSTLGKPIERAMAHLNYLNGILYNIGAPRAIPTRRFDPGPNVGINTTGQH